MRVRIWICGAKWDRGKPQLLSLEAERKPKTYCYEHPEAGTENDDFFCILGCRRIIAHEEAHLNPKDAVDAFVVKTCREILLLEEQLAEKKSQLKAAKALRETQEYKDGTKET